MPNNRPIAVLDTGAGGLSVVAELRHSMPMEEIHYFADYANLPYGLKSPELIRFLAMKAAKKIVERSQCKILVIACHTISVSCLEDIRSELDIPVIGMLEPSIKGLAGFIAAHQPSSLAIISTKATLKSGAYRRSWHLIDPKSETRLLEHACGSLVGLIEEAELSSREIKGIIEHVLPEELKKAQALLIGCTHFSVLKPMLTQVLKPGCQIIDAAHFVCSALITDMPEIGMADRNSSLPIKCYVSDNPERFLAVSLRFTAEKMEVELLSMHE